MAMEMTEMIGMGSPPRVRVALVGHGNRKSDAGITPACAGSLVKDPVVLALFIFFF